MATAKLVWTRNLPEEPGWYWHRNPEDEDDYPQPVEVLLAMFEDYPRLMCMHYDDLVFNVPGEWAGPLPLPVAPEAPDHAS